MHHRWQLKAVAALLILLASAPRAQGSKIGVYFDEYGDETRIQVNAGQPFQFFVGASGISGDINAFGCQLQIDPLVTVTSRKIPFPNALNIGNGDNWIVGIGDEVTVSGTLVLLEYGAVLLSEAESLRIEILPADSSDGPRMPEYVLAADSRLMEFDEVTGASINAEKRSWGNLKDTFKDQ